MRKFFSSACLLSSIVILAAGCATAPKDSSEKFLLRQDAADAVSKFKLEDPDISSFFTSSVAYAVFPQVGKAGLLLGGAYGRGVLYEKNEMVGWCDLSQATVGGQIGGQTYHEIIFFEDAEALARFKTGNFTFAAQLSAVALKSGAAANAKYADGVVAFTLPEAGLMAEASIGGQSFTYIPR